MQQPVGLCEGLARQARELGHRDHAVPSNVEYAGPRTAVDGSKTDPAQIFALDGLVEDWRLLPHSR